MSLFLRWHWKVEKAPGSISDIFPLLSLQPDEFFQRNRLSENEEENENENEDEKTELVTRGSALLLLARGSDLFFRQHKKRKKKNKK